MHIKTLVVALLGMSAAVEAAEIGRRSPFAQALERRQQGGARNGGGANRGNNNNNNAGANRGNNNNAGANRGNNNNNNGGGGNNNGGGGGGGGRALNTNVVQQGSQFDGNNPGADGQAASVTSDNNFINFCQGQTLTNGQQISAGSCNGIPMGQIPATRNMVSSLFVNPKNGDRIQARQDFKIQVQMLNFNPGTFTNATSTYYSAPQQLGPDGNIIGHTHVTVQAIDQNSVKPLDPTKFAFFKGINDAGNGKGLLSADVTGGLPPGNYRVCSMSSSSNHQPVLMPVAQRGAQDDCVRFNVVGGGGGRGVGGGGGGSGGGGGGGEKQGKGRQ